MMGDSLVVEHLITGLKFKGHLPLPHLSATSYNPVLWDGSPGMMPNMSGRTREVGCARPHQTHSASGTTMCGEGQPTRCWLVD